MIIGVPLWAVFIAGVRYFREHALKKKSMPSEDKAYENMDYLDPETLQPVKRTSELSKGAVKRKKNEEEEEKK